MKRGELAAAIRISKGNPLMQVTLPGSAQPIKLGIMKMILLEQIEVAFPDSKVQETGLHFDPETMMLSFEAVEDEPEPVTTFVTEEDGLFDAPSTGVPLDDLF